MKSWMSAALVVLAGCGGPPAPSTGTGAKEAVQSYYDAIFRQDWPQAYSTLHQDSRKRTSQEQFTRLAQNYCRNLGFDLQAMHLRACEEHGDEAIAHVTLVGRGKSQQYRDALSVRRAEAGWAVVLPANFGQARSR